MPKKDIVSSENIAELNEFELFKIENNIIDDNIATEQYFKFKTKGQQVMNIDKRGQKIFKSRCSDLISDGELSIPLKRTTAS